MINPALSFIAFMGGRSWQEARECRENIQLDTSITLGALSLCSMLFILIGQYLFWSNAGVSYAIAIAAGNALFLTLFYRLLIRAFEVSKAMGKVLIMACCSVIVATNALLVGHEVVIFLFKDQVAEAILLQGNENIIAMRTSSQKSQDLSGLRSEASSTASALAAATTAMNTLPPTVTALQSHAQSCEAQLNQLTARLPAPEASNYRALRRQQRTQSQQCAQASRQYQTALSTFQSQSQAQYQAALAQHQAAQAAANRAQSQSHQAVTSGESTLRAAAGTGFARHKAVHRAVADGKVPYFWLCLLIGLFGIIEGIVLLIKLCLPTDNAGHDRISEVLRVECLGQLQIQLAHAAMAAMPQQMQSLNEEYQSDLKRLAKSLIIPSMATRMAADMFHRAAQATRKAQQYSQAAPAAVIEELAKIMPGMAKAQMIP